METYLEFLTAKNQSKQFEANGKEGKSVVLSVSDIGEYTYCEETLNTVRTTDKRDTSPAEENDNKKGM